jgi:methionyl-tRNA formyltransferase
MSIPPLDSPLLTSDYAGVSLTAVFFGTPEFAVPSLSQLLESGARVPLVITQPDRPVGRHAVPLPSAVARLAAVRGIRMEKPEKLRGNSEMLDRVRGVAPDIGVVVAYGRILPPELLALARLGFVNVHASLLPKYRGASPIPAALLAGDRETGVVTMKIVEELDAGPLYLERRVEIGEREDAGRLSRRLASAGGELLVETLAGLERGALAARPQEGAPTFCRPIRREDGQIDWTCPAAEIDRRLRAFTPWPGVYTFLGGERLKIHGLEPGPATERAPGTLWLEGDLSLVAVGDARSLVLTRVQRAGRRIVGGAEFARGIRSLPARFSTEDSAPG